MPCRRHGGTARKRADQRGQEEKGGNDEKEEAGDLGEICMVRKQKLRPPRQLLA